MGEAVFVSIIAYGDIQENVQLANIMEFYSRTLFNANMMIFHFKYLKE